MRARTGRIIARTSARNAAIARRTERNSGPTGRARPRNNARTVNRRDKKIRGRRRNEPRPSVLRLRARRHRQVVRVAPAVPKPAVTVRAVRVRSPSRPNAAAVRTPSRDIQADAQRARRARADNRAGAARAVAADAAGEREERSTSMTKTIVLLALLGSPAALAAQTATPRTFAVPEDAVKALAETVRTGDLEALRAIFGPEGRELVDTSNPTAARMNRRVFAVAFREQWHLEDATPTQKTLVVGNENWPFPVPIVKGPDGWRFDAAAGKEEVLARRIGRNELDAIATVRAYVSAQRRYAQQGHDGKPAGVHAIKFQ